MPASYEIPILDALFVFPLVALLIFVPICVAHYRRFGQLHPLRAAVFYSFVFYLICAFFLTLLPLPEITDDFCERHAATTEPQLVPLASVALIFSVARSWTPTGMLANGELLQVVFNVLMLLPFGLYLRYLYRARFVTAVLLGFCFSLFFEVVQLTAIFGIYPCPFRLFDVDDLWLNTLGAALGWLALPLFFFLPKLEPHPISADRAEVAFTPFRRMIAFVIDWVLWGSGVLAAAAAIPALRAGAGEIALQVAGLAVVFVAVPIVLKGATAGQWLCRCHCRNAQGGSASAAQLALRAAVFFGVPYAVGVAAGWMARPDSEGYVGYMAVAALGLQLLTFCVFAVPMLFRHDHRGPHGLLSGTRIAA